MSPMLHTRIKVGMVERLLKVIEPRGLLPLGVFWNSRRLPRKRPVLAS